MPERNHMRNIRPKADKPLPVVDFKAEAEATKECPQCGGFGDDHIDCEACEGMGCDDESNPCTSCEGTGMREVVCPYCEGSGLVDDE